MWISDHVNWKGRKVTLPWRRVSGLPDCHAGPKHFLGSITLSFHSQNHCSTRGTVRRGKLPWELTRCLVSQSPCPAGAQQWLWEQIPNITGADTKRQLSYSSTDKALSSSRQQTSKKDVPVVGCQRKKREKISRDLENMTEETFIQSEWNERKILSEILKKTKQKKRWKRTKIELFYLSPTERIRTNGFKLK